MTGRRKEKNSNYVEKRVISPVAAHSGVQEEYHSKVQDPLQQRPSSGIEKYGTKVQEDHSDQQSATDERSEQIAVYTWAHRGISVLGPAGT